MQSSSSGRFQRYCYVQYQDMFNTIEQIVIIEQNLLWFIPEFKTEPIWCRIANRKLQLLVGEIIL